MINSINISKHAKKRASSRLGIGELELYRKIVNHSLSHDRFVDKINNGGLFREKIGFLTLVFDGNTVVTLWHNVNNNSRLKIVNKINI